MKKEKEKKNEVRRTNHNFYVLLEVCAWYVLLYIQFAEEEERRLRSVRALLHHTPAYTTE